MKTLNGSELAGFIKERHARQARALKVRPKLAIIQAKDDPVINTYVRLKQKYGADIGGLVEVHKPKQAEIPKLIEKLNNDPSVHGIIIQLPVPDPSQTDKLVDLVSPQKDVDALGKKAKFTPATPMAILWLLSGYNIELKDKTVLIIGRGKLVGTPLGRILLKTDTDVNVADQRTRNLKAETLAADVIVTATGTPGVLSADMVKKGAVVVDAGVASESGKTVGDLAEDVYKREDLTITPKRGGVGPLTVCALFENLIQATGANNVKS